MKRVTGIGGIFFKAKDPAALQEWYKQHLGLDVQIWGGAAVPTTDADGTPMTASTIWSIHASDSDCFAPSTAPFMVNYRVADARALAKVLRDEGCNVLDKIDESDFGIFAWVIAAEGNKVELWQLPAGSRERHRLKRTIAYSTTISQRSLMSSGNGACLEISQSVM